jgi:hypothetical protein
VRGPERLLSLLLPPTAALTANGPMILTPGLPPLWDQVSFSGGILNQC